MTADASNPTAVTTEGADEKLSRRAILSSLSAWTGGALALIIAVVVVGPWLLGYKSNVVLTKSMYPTISPGDMVVVDPKLNVNDIRIGDIIVTKHTKDQAVSVTHRVKTIAIGKQGPIITTQGDNNNGPDDPLGPGSEILGRVANFPGTNHPYVLPKLGYVQAYPMLSIGLFVVFAFCVLFLGKPKRKEAEENSEAAVVETQVTSES